VASAQTPEPEEMVVPRAMAEQAETAATFQYLLQATTILWLTEFKPLLGQAVMVAAAELVHQPDPTPW